MKQIILLFSVLIFLSACDLGNSQIEVEIEQLVSEVAEEKKDFVCGQDKVKDADGNEYKTAYFDVDGGHDVTKKGQCWMAENLKVGSMISDKRPPKDDLIPEWYLIEAIPLYFKEEVFMNYTIKNSTICPEGWMFPLKKDWQNLSKSIALSIGEYEYNELLSFDFGKVQHELPNIPIGEQEKLKHRQDSVIANKLITGVFNANLLFDENYSYSYMTFAAGDESKNDYPGANFTNHKLHLYKLEEPHGTIFTINKEGRKTHRSEKKYIDNSALNSVRCIKKRRS